MLDCLDMQRDWGGNWDGNGVKGGLNRGGGGRVHNKGSGLDVGTPRCSSWIRTQPAVCLFQGDVMAASCAAHRHSQYSPVFPPSDTQYKLIIILKMMSSPTHKDARRWRDVSAAV